MDKMDRYHNQIENRNQQEFPKQTLVPRNSKRMCMYVCMQVYR